MTSEHPVLNSLRWIMYAWMWCCSITYCYYNKDPLGEQLHSKPCTKVCVVTCLLVSACHRHHTLFIATLGRLSRFLKWPFPYLSPSIFSPHYSKKGHHFLAALTFPFTWLTFSLMQTDINTSQSKRKCLIYIQVYWQFGNVIIMQYHLYWNEQFAWFCKSPKGHNLGHILLWASMKWYFKYGFCKGPRGLSHISCTFSTELFICKIPTICT